LVQPTVDPATLEMPQALDQAPGGMIFITVHPDRLAPAILTSVDILIAVGESPDQTVRAFGDRLGLPLPELEPATLQADEALAWFRQQPDDVCRLRLAPVHRATPSRV
jgi:hypothetical protein